jgi:two-component system cell cycle response regulator DivK
MNVQAREVLVIEDNRANMRLACLLLEHAGYRVLQARDAEAGIRLARERQPDLILMDIQLPGMDGLSATRTLKQDALTRAIKVVAVTGRAMQDDRTQIHAAGCDAYLAKPLDAPVFLDTVAAVLAGGRR